MTSTRPTERVVGLPLRSKARRRGVALDAHDTPLALPRPLRHILQRWVKAVGVVANVAVIAQQKSTLVGRLATALADGALQTPPSFLQHNLRYLGNSCAKRMIALATLRTGKQSAFLVLSQAAAHYANILRHHKKVLATADDDLIFIRVILFRVGLLRGSISS